LTGYALLLAVALILVVPAAATTPAYYTPAAHDRFSYDETVSVNNGVGDYAGYTDATVINGSVEVTAVYPNGTAQAYYYNADHYSNSDGQDYSWTSSGPFGFSSQSFLYVNGTDNETGYVTPTVWFYIDNALPAGAAVTLLDSSFTVVSTSDPYDLGTGAGGWVKTIFVEGNGSFARNDSYGEFNAAYNWKAYFDPSTGYIVAYLYTEQDTNSSSGFTLTDALAVTQTSYPLTSAAGSSSSTGTGSQGSVVLLYALIAGIALVVIVVVIVIAVLASRRRERLPRHSVSGQVPMAPRPVGPPPPPVNLIPAGQPPVQQIIIKETVKVNCQYCGSLIDSTAQKCPFCGATRT